MERKLEVYKRYRDDFGVDFSKTERDLILNNFNTTGVEVMVGKKMFRQKQELAAIRIQSWWRMCKCRLWYRLIKEIRISAAQKLQRQW